MVVCAAAVAVGDAAANACRNRSSPVRRRTHLRRLRRAMTVPNGPSVRNEVIVRNVTTARNEVDDLNFRIEVDDQNGLPERIGPSVLNTGRRRATSPSFCRESRSRNIPVWRPHRQGRPHPSDDPPLRPKSGLRNRLQKSSPTMNLSLQWPLLRLLRLRLKRRLRSTKRLYPCTTNHRVPKTRPARGTANSNAFTR